MPPHGAHTPCTHSKLGAQSLSRQQSWPSAPHAKHVPVSLQTVSGSLQAGPWYRAERETASTAHVPPGKSCPTQQGCFSAPPPPQLFCSQAPRFAAQFSPCARHSAFTQQPSSAQGTPFVHPFVGQGQG